MVITCVILDGLRRNFWCREFTREEKDALSHPLARSDTFEAGIRKNRLTADFSAEQTAQLIADVGYYIDIAAGVEADLWEGYLIWKHAFLGRLEAMGRWLV